MSTYTLQTSTMRSPNGIFSSISILTTGMAMQRILVNDGQKSSDLFQFASEACLRSSDRLTITTTTVLKEIAFALISNNLVFRALILQIRANKSL